MKIKAPDITATGVLAIAALAVGAYVVWRGSKIVGDATAWVSNKASAVADAAIGEAKLFVEPISTNKTIVNDPTKMDEQNAWDNTWVNVFAAGGMGA